MCVFFFFLGTREIDSKNVVKFDPEVFGYKNGTKIFFFFAKQLGHSRAKKMLPSSSSGSMQSAKSSVTSSSLNFSPEMFIFLENSYSENFFFLFKTHPKPLNCVPIQRQALCRFLLCRTT